MPPSNELSVALTARHKSVRDWESKTEGSSIYQESAHLTPRYSVDIDMVQTFYELNGRAMRYPSNESRSFRAVLPHGFQQFRDLIQRRLNVALDLDWCRSSPELLAMYK